MVQDINKPNLSRHQSWQSESGNRRRPDNKMTKRRYNDLQAYTCLIPSNNL